MKRKPTNTPKAAERRFHVARCRVCGQARAAVEVGEGDRLGVSVMVDAGYTVTVEQGPISFRPHSKECV